MSFNKILSLCCLLLSSLIPLYGDYEDFKRGFIEGYKTVKGDMVIIPVIPVQPITPVGSNDYREGLKAGIKAAKN